MNKGQNQFVIVDAMAIAYKAYFAFINRPLINSKGEPTSAIYGFMTQLIKIIEDSGIQILVENDGHWNYSGNKIVGEKLAEYFKEIGGILPDTEHTIY